MYDLWVYDTIWRLSTFDINDKLLYVLYVLSQTNDVNLKSTIWLYHKQYKVIPLFKKTICFTYKTQIRWHVQIEWTTKSVNFSHLIISVNFNVNLATSQLNCKKKITGGLTIDNVILSEICNKVYIQ